MYCNYESQIKLPLELISIVVCVSGENTVNGDHSDAHHSTFSHSSKEVRYFIFVVNYNDKLLLLFQFVSLNSLVIHSFVYK